MTREEVEAIIALCDREFARHTAEEARLHWLHLRADAVGALDALDGWSGFELEMARTIAAAERGEFYDVAKGKSI